MNLKKISPENKKKIITILIILIVIVLFFGIKKGIQNGKIRREINRQVYELLKAPEPSQPQTEEEINVTVYEALKAPEQNN